MNTKTLYCQTLNSLPFDWAGKVQVILVLAHLFVKVPKVRVHCFSMQVEMNKCFLLNPEKNFGADPSCRFREKRTFNSENDVTEPKARLL